MSCLLGNVRVGANSPLQVQIYNAEDGTPVDISTFINWTANGKHATSLVDTAFAGVTVVGGGSDGLLRLDMETDTFSAGIYDITIRGTESVTTDVYIFPFQDGTLKMKVV